MLKQPFYQLYSQFDEQQKTIFRVHITRDEMGYKPSITPMEISPPPQKKSFSWIFPVWNWLNSWVYEVTRPDSMLEYLWFVEENHLQSINLNARNKPGSLFKVKICLTGCCLQRPRKENKTKKHGPSVPMFRACLVGDLQLFMVKQLGLWLEYGSTFLSWCSWFTFDAFTCLHKYAHVCVCQFMLHPNV